MLRQHVTEEVGEHALHDAAAVEPHAGRAPHDPDGAIDLDRRPAPLRAWTGGMARRGERKRLLQWDRRGLVAAVARRLQLADEGRIHEPAGARGGGHRGVGHAGHQLAHGDLGAGIAVEA